MGRYFDEIKKTMSWLAEQPDTIFIGQAVAYSGTFLHATLEQVDPAKRVEMPVCEQFQMQMTLGLALGGFVPISVYPRQNFLLLATGDLVNMIDRLPDMSGGKVIPPLIIRAAAGTTRPIHPGHQHVGNFADAFRALLGNVKVVELHEPDQILPAYQAAYQERRPTLIIEFGDFYADK